MKTRLRPVDRHATHPHAHCDRLLGHPGSRGTAADLSSSGRNDIIDKITACWL